MVILKIIFKKYKKNHFKTFLNKKNLKPQSLLQS
jgi:hypothetical protein